MEYKVFDGVHYEIDILSLGHGADLICELTDMSDSGGTLAEIRISPTAISSNQQQPVPLEVFEWWTAVIIAASRALREVDEP